MMEYLEGVKKAKTLEIGELLAQAEGTEVKVNGAVHTIRDMGNVAFVILRKRDGLVQCVFEEGVTAFDLKRTQRGICGGSTRYDPQRRTCRTRH